MNTTIDNGNHLLLSGNDSALAYLDAVGARQELRGPERCEIAFADMASGERWILRPNEGRLPWWLLFEDAPRPAHARGRLSLGRAASSEPPLRPKVADVMDCSAPLYERLWGPFFLAALNTDPKGGSAALAAMILRQTLARGGRRLPSAGRRPRPVARLHRSRAQIFAAGRRASALRAAVCARSNLPRGASQDWNSSMIRSRSARRIWSCWRLRRMSRRRWRPVFSTPRQVQRYSQRPFQHRSAARTPPILGVVNASVQWLFAYPDRLSVTVSDAGALIDLPREQLAADLWREVAGLTGLSDDLPSLAASSRSAAPTFAATPEERGAPARAPTQWSNLLLAGDYVRHRPARPIEGAIRSGDTAARLAMERFGAN